MRYYAEKRKKEKKPYRMRTKVNFRFASNRSIISGLPVKMHGFKLGVEFLNRFRTGFMVAWLPSNAIETDGLPVGVESREFDMIALGTFFEYLIFHNYRWELSVPVDLLFADFTMKEVSVYDHTVRYDTLNDFPVMQVGCYGQYNVNYWLGVGASIGVRTGLGPSAAVNKAITALYYTMGIKFMLGKFLRTIFVHQKVLQERIDYFETRRPDKADKLRRRLRN